MLVSFAVTMEGGPGVWNLQRVEEEVIGRDLTAEVGGLKHCGADIPITMPWCHGQLAAK